VTAEQPLRVLVVDDHPMWRDSVERDLTEAGHEVVASLDRGGAAAQVARAVRPDVALVDLQLPDRSGVEVVTDLVALETPPYVLVLSASGERADVLAAVSAGATGYLVKSATRAELLDAVEQTGRGEAVFSAGLAALVLGEFRRIRAGQASVPGTSEGQLTDRETEVLRLVATGMSYRQIAERLVISHRTVQNHVQATLGKLQLHNRVELTRYALDQGLDTSD
jgi:DNA-binding NarL/FixJ family response regulator